MHCMIWNMHRLVFPATLSDRDYTILSDVAEIKTNIEAWSNILGD